MASKFIVAETRVRFAAQDANQWYRSGNNSASDVQRRIPQSWMAESRPKFHAIVVHSYDGYGHRVCSAV